MKRTALLTVCIALLAASCALAGAITYRIRDLGLLPDTVSALAKGVNDSGVVVGYAIDSNKVYHAFCWTAAKGMVELPALPRQKHCIAWAVNNKGQIAGSSGVGGQDYQLFVRTVDGRLLVTGQRVTEAKAMNEKGQTAGRSKANTAGIRNADGKMVDLGLGLAYGINGLGEAVGDRYDSATKACRAVYWSGAGESVDLGQGTASDINDHGQIVGSASGSAYVWDRYGNSVKLPTLAGHRSATADSINNARQIVGSLYGLAVLWNPDGTVTALPGLAGCSQTYATCISENGFICGEAKDSSGNYHAVLWEPVPRL